MNNEMRQLINDSLSINYPSYTIYFSSQNLISSFSKFLHGT